MLVGSLQVTDILQMVICNQRQTLSQVKLASHSPLLEETYLLTKMTINVSTNHPYTLSDQDFHWMVVGSVQMTDRLQMVNYMRPAKNTLPGQAGQSLSLS